MMQLVVISSPDRYKSEVETVVELFKLGLETFHVRKPKFSVRKMKAYLSSFPPEYFDRIIIHSHHILAKKFNLKGIHITRSHKKRRLKTWIILKYLTYFNKDIFLTSSCHGIQNLSEYDYDYNYLFLSPVFDSISKDGHYASFSEDQIKFALKRTKHKVFALGGVDADHVAKVEELGFQGMALLGALWNTDSDPLEVYKEVLQKKEHRGSSVVKINPLKLRIEKSA